MSSVLVLRGPIGCHDIAVTGTAATSCPACGRDARDGTVDKLNNDGITAEFGAPVALEDHALRAWLAGSAIHEEAKQLAVDVQSRDGVRLWLRVWLNSGDRR